MDEHPDSALHYGHVGRAVYLPEEQAWTFARSFTRSAPILYTGVTKTTVSSPFTPDEVEPIRRVPDRDAGKLITEVYPDLAASWSSIRQEPLSKAITTATEQFDPESSSLFDIGYAVNQRRYPKRLPPVHISVSVTGECGNALSFQTIEEDDLELSWPTRVAMRAPSITGTEKSQWSKCGAPIRQVNFARLLDDDPVFMAARLITSTVIFRPLYHLDPVPMRFPDNAPKRSSTAPKNSRLDANPVLEVSVVQTGGFPHADVTFNPWYQQQFGIVDIRGNWTVWEIEEAKQPTQSHWSARVVKSGSLPTSDTTFKGGRPRLDGWASIEWAHEIGTIIVANRRNVAIYAFLDDQVPPRTVELGMTKQSEWVLGLRRNPRNLSQFFVLTTNRILWFDMTTPPGETSMGLSLYPQVSRRHFRDPNDTSLRLSELVVYQDLYIVLFSQLTHLVQVFPSPFISDEETNFVSVPDPFVIDAPLMMHIPSNGRDTVQFSTFLLKEVGHTPLHTKSLHEPDLAVIKLFWMDSKLAIHESVFQGPQGDPDEPDLVCESRVLRLHRRYNQPSRPIPDDDFIVDDWDEPEMQQEFVHPRTDRAVPISMEEDWQWTLDFSDVYAMAIGQIEIPQKTSKATKRQKPKARTFDGFISDLEREMKNLSTKQTLSETMVELSDKTLLTEDLDKCTDEVKRLFSAIMPKDPDPDARHRFLLLPLQYQTVTYGIPSRLPGEADRDMLNIYDRMVDDWVSTLSRDIPVPLRLAKEKLIRKIAADLLLSHLVKITTSLDRVILPKPADPIMDQNEKSTTQNKYLQSSFFSQSNYHIPASQSQMTNGSLGSQRNPTPKPAPSKYSAVPVFDGLSAFTTFKKPRATAENVSNVLSHWSVGNNPSAYIWERIEDEETRRSASQTPKRKKKRLQARDQPLPPTPLVPMVRSWGTQPLTPQINVSSQPDVSMTQTERGIFGARELKKKKKKKRMAGF